MRYTGKHWNKPTPRAIHYSYFVKMLSTILPDLTTPAKIPQIIYSKKSDYRRLKSFLKCHREGGMSFVQIALV